MSIPVVSQERDPDATDTTVYAADPSGSVFEVHLIALPSVITIVSPTLPAIKAADMV
jgi:hypothetical protein